MIKTDAGRSAASVCHPYHRVVVVEAALLVGDDEAFGGGASASSAYAGRQEPSRSRADAPSRPVTMQARGFMLYSMATIARLITNSRPPAEQHAPTERSEGWT